MVNFMSIQPVLLDKNGLDIKIRETPLGTL